MDRARAFVTQKLGPLPLWAWAAIGLAVLLGYMYFAKSGLFGGGTGGGQPGSQGAGSGGNIGGGGAADLAAPMGQTVPFQVNGASGYPYGASFAGTPVVGAGLSGSSTAPSPVNLSQSVGLAALSAFGPGPSPSPSVGSVGVSGGRYGTTTPTTLSSALAPTTGGATIVQ